MSHDENVDVPISLSVGGDVLLGSCGTFKGWVLVGGRPGRAGFLFSFYFLIHPDVSKQAASRPAATAKSHAHAMLSWPW